MNFRTYLEIFAFDFNMTAWRQKLKSRGNIVSKQRSSKPDKLVLYHGFNTDPSTFGYKFDPKMSEQGMIWFTHKLIRGYNPIDYASSRGSFLLTYPLDVMTYIDHATYQDGSKEDVVPEDLEKLVVPTENCSYMMSGPKIIKLPNGWVFTYKNEKFIGTSQPIQATPNQVSQT